MGVSKRKRQDHPELEVDVDAPEPPSKKALRRAKKGKPPLPKEDDSDVEDAKQKTHVKSNTAKSEKTSAGRSDAPGIWIGNLPWTITKDDLMKFFTGRSDGAISVSAITRINMPGPTAAALSGPNAKHRKPTNRGFAHIDFQTIEARDAAIALSETLLAGRSVLIKDAKSFAGRPEVAVKPLANSTKPPSTKIFIGNLGFETTEDELRDHFSQCGAVKTAFMAKFHDTNKCKGYAWITFEELVSAEKAMRGWVEIQPEESENEEEDENEDGARPSEGQEDGDDSAKNSQAKARRRKKKSKPRKWYINRLQGRDLRMEYAEDATTRYVKRFGKGKQDGVPGAANEILPPEERRWEPVPSKYLHRADSGMEKSEGNRESQRSDVSEPAHGSRPKAASTQSKDISYLTGAVMEGKGKKVTFD